MNKIFLAVLLSILPISELRVGIPFLLSVSEFTALNFVVLPLICIVANILVVLPIFIFLDFLHHRFLHLAVYKKLFDFFILKIQKKAKKLEPRINKYGYIALALFVAIPLPVTGAWTGTIIAWLLGLNRKKSFAAIALGVLIAGVIVTLLALASFGVLRIALS